MKTMKQQWNAMNKAQGKNRPMPIEPTTVNYQKGNTPDSVASWQASHGMTGTFVSSVKKGELVRFRDSDSAPVWVRGDYDRASKTFAFHLYDHVNHERFAKGSRVVFVGFTF